MEDDSTTEKEYNPFIVNRSLSYFRDTVFYANEMNKYSSLPYKLQYEFYLNIVPKKKRFSKWSKASVESAELLKYISAEYQCSTKKAEYILGLLNQTQIEFIKKQYTCGGRK
jgi:hypothetical protein